MSLPIATRTVTILRADGLEAHDSYDPAPDYRPLVSGVRAVISTPTGAERTSRAEAETVHAHLVLDPFDGQLTHLDRLTDDLGRTWRVEWVQEVTGMGLDHTAAGLVRYHGEQP
jgi:hypothetical protein